MLTESILPRLRSALDVMPSPVEDKPGLLIRDPLRYSDFTLIVPPPLLQCLEFFDGAHTALDLREFLVRATGQLDVGGVIDHLLETLSEAGFLEDDRFASVRHQAEVAFAEAPIREPVHAGSGYPDEAAELTVTFQEYLPQAPQPDGLEPVFAIAAPHVSPIGGVEAYRAAYSALSPADAQRTFVILGTSHYGEPDRLGLTRKPFVTPLGETVTDGDLADELLRKAGDGAIREDYCHSVEHSIEFQVVFLQHLFGPRIRILPVLCGPFVHGMYVGTRPEEHDSVKRAIGALGEIAAREGDRLLWVLGVDMAHMGRRYGDPIAAHAGRDEMAEVTGRDRSRIQRMEQGDAQGFWELVRENHDDLKWCGSAPIYTFLRAAPQARGKLLHYQQWNIDEHSVVSFAGMRFESR